MRDKRARGRYLILSFGRAVFNGEHLLSFWHVLPLKYVLPLELVYNVWLYLEWTVYTSVFSICCLSKNLICCSRDGFINIFRFHQALWVIVFFFKIRAFYKILFGFTGRLREILFGVTDRLFIYLESTMTRPKIQFASSCGASSWLLPCDAPTRALSYLRPFGRCRTHFLQRRRCRWCHRSALKSNMICSLKCGEKSDTKMIYNYIILSQIIGYFVINYQKYCLQ